MAQRRDIHDRFFKQAKAEGYAARSAYKLKEIQHKRQIMKRNDRVLDLGCAPGSWVQVAAEIVGRKGLVVGIDLKPVVIDSAENVRTVVGDIFNVTAEELLGNAERGAQSAERQDARPQASESDPSALRSALRAPRSAMLFNVVLSDMAPSTEGGGGGFTDHMRSIDLCRRVLDLLPAMLKTGGHCVMKVFEGEAYPALLKDTGKLFAEVKGFKPEASREVSREMFIVAKGFRPVALGAEPSRPADKHAIAPARPRPREGWGDDKVKR